MITKRIVPLDFELTDTIGDLKKRLEKDEGIKANHIVIVF